MALIQPSMTYIDSQDDLLWQGYDLVTDDEHARQSRRLENIGVILAPSGAGKSHFARGNPDVVIDGDAVVSSVLGWPGKLVSAPQKHWSQNGAVCWAHWVAILSMVTFDPLRRYAVFNGAAWERPSLTIVQVVPSHEDMKRNISQRVVPAGHAHAWEQWLTARSKYMKTGLPTFQTFELAVEYLDDTAGVRRDPPPTITLPKVNEATLYGAKPHPSLR